MPIPIDHLFAWTLFPATFSAITFGKLSFSAYESQNWGWDLARVLDIYSGT